METLRSWAIPYLERKYNEGLSWQELASLIREETGRVVCSGTLRSLASKMHMNEGGSWDSFRYEATLANFKASDEKREANAELRIASRIDVLKEMAQDVAMNIASAKSLLPPSAPKFESTDKIITICLSDWHYGITVDNFINKYDPEIARERIVSVLTQVLEVSNEVKPLSINVVNLGDLISGRIHSTVRLSNRLDAITQIEEVSEILAEFLTILQSSVGVPVHYYDCLDNHSRVEGNLKESIPAESLCRITHWFLEKRLEEHPYISIHSNDLGPDILTFSIFDFKVIGVHGHEDKSSQIVSNLTLLTDTKYDLILTAHLHHASFDERNCTFVILNGSLMATDDYAKSLRLSSHPSQTLIISTPHNVIDSIKVLYANS